jgi:16S rRNA (cytidine1402-2'-O)-methyltransferase
MTAAPGPCAAICALTVSGLASDRFLFAGFPPATRSARVELLSGLVGVQATLIFYESPKRLAAFLADLVRILGPDRSAVVCRELTKRFEEVSRGRLQELAEDFGKRTIKGEIVVLVARAPVVEASVESIATALATALETMSVKDAASFVSQTLGVPRKTAYRLALDRAKIQEGPDAL